MPPDASDRRHARTVFNRLKRRYPEIRTALDYENPWQLLVVTVMSAQTTDENVNAVAPNLFQRWPDPEDLAAAPPEEVEETIFSTGFYRQKAQSIIALSADIVEHYGGEVPRTIEELVQLRGVGRKTASVVLAEAWGMPAIAVDTHVKRVTHRLGLTDETKPDKVEADLRALFPESDWSGISMRFIEFGREVCDARKPRCWECEMVDRCRYPDKTPAPS